jgi:gamma-glutamyltranspeptidase/glutathione hydrolase
LDFRESAPLGLLREPFESRPLAQEQEGHLIGVPGEIRGLFELHKRAGKLRWSDLVQVAARRALDGFTVDRHLANMLAASEGKLKSRAGFTPLFFPGGKPALLGSRLTHPALGKTLTRIAAEGPAAFYEGAVANDLVTTANAAGGQLALEDFRSYAPKWREALRVSYEGFDVYTMPAPSAGGFMLAQVLEMFPADYLRRLGHGSPAYNHLLAEAFRAAVSDRLRYLGDPDYEKVDLAALMDPARLRRRRASIALDRSHALPRFGLEEKGTHALVTADREGNVISLTTTINHLFGSKIYASSSGVFLNNELDDFGSKAQVGPFGMSESPNKARPLARPVSSMTPTIVTKNGAVTLALGGSGGMAIATNVTQVLLSALVFDLDPAAAVAADRVYIPTSGPFMLVELGTSATHIADLERRGEIVGTNKFTGSAVQLLRLDGRGARAASDPRKYGLAKTNGSE